MHGKCECPSKFINLMKALHEKMQVHVAQGNYIFKEFAVTNDVKQGSVLAPTLYSLYRTAMLEVAFVLGTVSTSKLILILTCLMSPVSEEKHAQPRS